MGLRDLSIRKFRTEDAKAVANIISKNLLKENDNNTEVTPKFVLTLSNKRKMYVTLNDNKIVGTASIDHDTISNVFVDVDYHNQGIEGALISLLEEIAANHGMKLVKLEASKTAQRLIEKLGYNVVGDTEVNELGESIIMEKYLD